MLFKTIGKRPHNKSQVLEHHIVSNSKLVLTQTSFRNIFFLKCWKSTKSHNLSKIFFFLSTFFKMILCKIQLFCKACIKQKMESKNLQSLWYFYLQIIIYTFFQAFNPSSIMYAILLQMQFLERFFTCTFIIRVLLL